MAEKKHKLKQLLLAHLKDLQLEFLKIGQTIGFSKFCQFCPKYCIAVNSSSREESACACEIHQNCKLIAVALLAQDNYKILLGKMVCDLSNRNCMLRSC